MFWQIENENQRIGPHLAYLQVSDRLLYMTHNTVRARLLEPVSVGGMFLSRGTEAWYCESRSGDTWEIFFDYPLRHVQYRGFVLRKVAHGS